MHGSELVKLLHRLAFKLFLPLFYFNTWSIVGMTLQFMFLQRCHCADGAVMHGWLP
jgi:hypothetical protein